MLTWLCVSGLAMVASRVANTPVLGVAWTTRSLVLSKLLSITLLASAPLVFDLSSPLLTWHLCSPLSCATRDFALWTCLSLPLQVQAEDADREATSGAASTAV